MPKNLIISVPCTDQQPDERSQFNFLRSLSVLQEAQPFPIPCSKLKVGTLDNLLECSDQLAKYDTAAEVIVTKHLNFLEEAEAPTPRAKLAFVANAQNQPISVSDFLRNFKWDEPQYPLSNPIKALIEQIQGQMTRAEESTRQKLSEFGETKSKVQNVEKKTAGNLSVKPIAEAVQKYYKKKNSSPIETEYLTTQFVVIPNHNEAEWNKTYSQLTNGEESFIVPGSSEVIEKDHELTLVSVVLFKRITDEFKTKIREKKWVYREYIPENELTEAQMEALRGEMSQKKTLLTKWLKSVFAECYVAWIHLKALRVFVESILRYGLPPHFTSLIVPVNPKQELALHREIGKLFPNLQSKFGDEDVADVGSLELKYPYVSLVVNAIEAGHR